MEAEVQLQQSVPQPQPAVGLEPEEPNSQVPELDLSVNTAEAGEALEATVPLVKQEQEAEAEAGLGYKECVLCASRTDAVYDIYYETTGGSVALCTYICKVANLNLDLVTYSKYACGACFDLINVVERSELEYIKQRECLLEIIGRNPLLEGCGAFVELDARAVPLEYVKLERCKTERRASSEDDEPLSSVRPQRHRRNTKLVRDPPHPPANRDHSSDDDFYWELDTNEEDNACSKSATGASTRSHKKGNRRRVKIKEEIEAKHPSEILEVQLREPEEETESKVPKKEPKDKVKPKIKGKKHLKKKKRSESTEPKVKKTKSGVPKSGSSKSGPPTCLECNKSFTKPCYLKFHMAEIHKKGPHEFICEVCGRGFRTKKQCEDHIMVHRGVSDWKCEPCNKYFPNKTAFLRHDKIHNGKPKYQCDLCGKSFIHHSSFRKHNLMHSGIRRAACDICGLAFFFNSHLKRHKRIHEGNEKRFECEVCGKKFSDKYYLQTHTKTHDKVRQRPPTPVDMPGRRKRLFRCEMCEQKFDRLFKLELHLVHDHNQKLKKGPPKPRNTWKKLQRAQAAAASMVNAIATAINANAKHGQLLAQTSSDPADVKPSVSSLNERMKEAQASSSQPFKSSPNHSMSPATYMSPPQTDSVVDADYQSHIRSSGSWPAALYHMGAAGYAGRMHDYSQH